MGIALFCPELKWIRSGNERRPCWLQPYDGLRHASSRHRRDLRKRRAARRRGGAAWTFQSGSWQLHGASAWPEPYDGPDGSQPEPGSGTADSATLHFNQRTDVIECSGENFQGVLTGLLSDLLQGAVNDALCDGLLAVQHDHVNKLGNFNATELRIRQNFAFGTSRRRGIIPLVKYLQSFWAFSGRPRFPAAT